MPDNNNNDNVLKLASSTEDKEKEYELVVSYKDKDWNSEKYKCNFFGVSIENPDFFLIGEENKDEFNPLALISVNSIRKVGIKEV